MTQDNQHTIMVEDIIVAGLWMLYYALLFIVLVFITFVVQPVSLVGVCFNLVIF